MVFKKKYTSNNDLENIISSLNKKFKIQLICRKSSVQNKFLLKVNLIIAS